MTTEIRGRLFPEGSYLAPRWPVAPLSPLDPFVRGAQLLASRKALFYSPGFNPPAFAQQRAVFTICDLIHVRVPGEAGALKRTYYERLVKPAVHGCFRVLTISDYSRRDLLDWSGADPSQVVDVGCGVDEAFFAPVTAWQPGYPYFLYVGGRKLHKNLDRLLEAYSRSRAASEVRFVLSGKPDAHLMALANRLGVADRLVFAGHIPDSELASYYRGATALLFPSYFEGFGLPPVEAMAGGTPVLTSTATSLPEAVGDAALTADPFSVDSLRDGIDRLAFDSALRLRLQLAGPIQARRHSWDNVAAKVGTVLADLRASVSA
ncbi:MAG: glycosyltransferase family 1 protein [Nevskia sp.]|nr:glycosyltransferase family 1 protein [Nevskia sp.]